MSRVLIIFSHPSHNSYNYSVLQKVISGLEANKHEITVNDLYSLRFDPLMTEGELYQNKTPRQIQQEQSKVLWSEFLFFIFPVWWWAPPAILKGWLERVLCLDFAFKYEVKSNGFVGNLQGRKSVIITTGSTDPETYQTEWQAGSQKDYLNEILTVCGIITVKQMSFYNIHEYNSGSQLDAYLAEIYNFSKSI